MGASLIFGIAFLFMFFRRKKKQADSNDEQTATDGGVGELPPETRPEPKEEEVQMIYSQEIKELATTERHELESPASPAGNTTISELPGSMGPTTDASGPDKY